MFATICWFQSLRIHLDASTVEAVQSAVEPPTRVSQGVLTRRWREYQLGIHTPQARVIEMSRKVSPDAAGIFESPLWNALNLNFSAHEIALSLIGTTSIYGDDLLARAVRFGAKNSLDPRWLRKRCQGVLREASLESLAVLAICARLAASHGATHLAQEFCRYAGYSLLIQGIWFYAHGVAHCLGEYFETDFVPANCNEPWMCNFSSLHYVSKIGSMSLALKRELASKQSIKSAVDEMDALIRMIGLTP